MSTIYPRCCRRVTVLLIFIVTSFSLFAQSRIGSGAFHTAIIRADGTLWTMGYNGYGELGNGTSTNSNFPVQIPGTWSSVAGGLYHTAAIKNDGTLWAWGLNSTGQLGDGSTTNHTSPVKIGTATDWVKVDCGSNFTVAVKSDGTLWAWGLNSIGQLGDGTTTLRTSPVQVPSAVLWTVNFEAGQDFVTAIKVDGTLWGWGNNSSGQLGNGTTTNAVSPVQVGSSTDWTYTSAGSYHAGAINSQGKLYTWGNNSQGQLGDGTTTNRLNPTLIGSFVDWSKLVCADYYTMGIKTSGDLFGWGNNANGQLSLGNLTNQLSPVSMGQTNVVYAGAMISTGFIIKSTDYDTYCAVGFNGFGQMGDETTIQKLLFTCVDLSPVISVSLTPYKLASGYQHTAAIRADGTLWTFGYNIYGQLGDGTSINKNYPVQVGSATNWVQVSAGIYHTMAIKSDGTLWGWGYNGYGQLGDGTATNRLSPVQIGTANDWVKVDCGAYHTVALKSDGSLWVWGYNGYGQLGDGTTTNRSVPFKINAFSGWKDISAGDNHTLGVKGNGTLWAWGYNAYGQLGDGTTNTSIYPTLVSNLSGLTIVSISAGANHSLAALSNGTVRSWGYNGYGQLGDGTTTTRYQPVSVTAINNCVDVAAGETHSLFRLSTGILTACGNNNLGQLGDGTISTRVAPVACSGVSGAVYICTNFRTSGYIGSNADLVCMTGDNSNGQHGDESYVNKTIFTCTNLTPVTVSTLSFPATKIACGNFHTAAIRADGTLWTWGLNTNGQLGDGTTTNKNYPVKVGTATNWIQVSCGYFHTMAIRSDGTLWAWGYNAYGQLGDGTTTNRLQPVQIGSATDWVKVDCGMYHTVALKSDGTLWTWGYNGNGQLGDGTTTTRATPLKISSFNGWKDVTAGGYHTLGIKGNGTLWAWGYNTYGELGDNTTADKSSPTPVTGIAPNTVSDLGAGIYHSAVVLTDGTAKTWGNNAYGQLGNGTITNSTVPVLMTGISTAVEVEQGAYHTLVRLTNGTVRACGLNSSGQLGDGTLTDRSVAVPCLGAAGATALATFYYSSGYLNTNPDIICMTGDNAYGELGDETNINKSTFSCVNLAPAPVTLTLTSKKAASGYMFTAAIRNDGSLWTWGYNAYGQLGDGTVVNKNYPVKVGTATNWSLVSCGFMHTMAIRSDGTLWAWGYNGYGQLGDGTTTNRLAPVQVGTANDWAKVECGMYHTVALKTDGSLWVWGYNGYGQLGDGTTANRASPVKINSASSWKDVDAGGNHTIGIKGDGTFWSWGYNAYGQLGDGTSTASSFPVKITTLTGPFLSISAGDNHSLAVLSNGTVRSWGYNATGQLGDGTTTNRFSPVSVLSLTNCVEAIAAESHSLFRLSTGALYACGYNGLGQLGDGTLTNRTSPVACIGASSAQYICAYYRNSGYIGTDPDVVCLTGDNQSGQIGDETFTNKSTLTCIDLTPVVANNVTSPASKLTSGLQHTVAIRADGSLWAWGANTYGQLGDGTTANKNYPVKVGTATNWTVVSGGQYHTMAIKSDGTLWGWGYNAYGQLGDGTTTNRLTPVQIGTATNWVKVECGLYHTIALNSDGVAYAWGYNGNGQLGDGTTTNRTTPTIVPSFTGWKDIAAGDYFSLGVKGDGKLWAWGYNGSGQLGDNTVTSRTLPVLVNGISVNSVVDISGGAQHSAAVLTNGTVLAWGYNAYGQLGNGTTTTSYVPVVVSGISTAVEVELGDLHTLVRLSDGTLRACGYNGVGQLGDGTTTNRTTPVVCSGVTGATYMGTFYRSSGYIGADADVVCMTGDNSLGQLGNETTINKTTFTCVDLTPTVLSLSISPARISEGLYHTLAIRTDGTLWAWGGNGYGQLGNGTTTGTLAPVAISPGITTWVQVAAGDQYSAAIRSDGTLWTWGFNGFGQLGDGTTTNRAVPVQVPGTNWVKVVCGVAHMLALKSDGTVWAWGGNFNGQLGDGTTNASLVPIKISSFSGWLDIACGLYHSLGIKGDGTLWSWGYNSFGQLGDGTTTDRYLPVPVTGISGPYASIAAGNYHSLVALSSGSVKSFGYNAYGQLGDNTTTNRFTPVAVSGITNCVQVASGDQHSVFRLSNGTISACGYNGVGGLGDGTTTTRLVPVTAIGTSNSQFISAYHYSSGSISSSAPNTFCMTGENSSGQLGDGTGTNRNTYGCISLSPVITTGALVTATYPQGASISIPYTVSGPPFTFGNLFKAEISNDGFATSTVFGSVLGTTSGTLNFALPCSLAPANNYAIRVIATLPTTIGTTSPTTITIVPNPSITSVNPSSGAPGTSIAINGNYFGLSGTVTLGSSTLAVTSWSNTVINATLPSSGVCSGNLTVTNNCGNASSGFAYTLNVVPAISSVTPNGTPGSSITITGTNFTNSGTAIIGSTNMSILSWKNDTIIALLPATGTCSGTITVTNACGSTSNLVPYTISNVPSITSITQNGTPGSNIVISGSNFTNSGSVKIGSTPMSVVSWSATSITATMPPSGVCSGNIEVTNSCSSTSNLVPYTLSITPVITSITPPNATPGSSIVIAGSNFTNSGTIIIGSTNMSTVSWKNDTIIALLPATGICSGTIAVTNACGSTSNLVPYTISIVPSITSITQNGAPGSNVVISGSDFTGSGSVKIGSTFMNVVSWTTNSITATLPLSGVCSGNIEVTNSCGSTSNLVPYTLSITPVITSITPPNATPGSSIVIAGSNFTNSGTVIIGSTPLNVASWSSSSITATLPSGSNICSGNIEVTNSCGTTSNQVTYTLNVAPVISSVSPLNALPGTTVTILGSNFSPSGNTVTVAGFNATINTQSATSLKIIIPAGACSGNIVVTNACGSTASFSHNAVVTPAVTIDVTPQTVCAGVTQTFSVINALNAGTPTYVWYKNGAPTGITTATFNYTTSNNNDQWYCKMTSTAVCASPTIVSSNTVVVNVTAAPTWYLDADNDGHYLDSPVTSCSSPGAGYNQTATTAGDCDDNDQNVWQSNTLYIDADGDGYTNGSTTLCYGGTIPAGYALSSNGTDCNDNSYSPTNNCGPNIWLGNTSDWSTAGNWSHNMVPASCGDDVVIPDLTIDPVISVPVNIGSIELQSGAVLTLNNDLGICGNFTAGSSTASLISGTGSLVLNGNTNQQLSGKLQLNSLTLNNVAGASLQAGASYDVMTKVALQNGNFNTSAGQLRFRSTGSSQIAILDDFSSGYIGTITGNITAQRAYDAASYQNAHYFGAPVSGATAGNLGSSNGSGGFVIPQAGCDEQYTAVGSPYGNVYSYDQSNATTCSMAGWKVEVSSAPLTNAKGYSVRKTGAGVLSLTGPPNTNTSYTTVGDNSNWSNITLQGRPVVSGWTLVSNPFLATLDLSTATVTGYDPVHAVWNVSGPYAGSYTDEDFIAPFQAFFVRKSNPGTAPYIISKGNLITNQQVFHQQNNAEILSLLVENTGNGLLDKTTIGFNAAATPQVDEQLDGYKMPGALTRHTVYSYNSDPNEWLMRNFNTSIATTATVNVGFEPGANGNYSISFEGLQSFDPTSYIMLEDKKTNTFHNARSGNYSFSASTTDNWNRFVLHFTPKAEVKTTDGTCSNNGQLTIEQPGTANWNYTVTNSSNVLVGTGSLNQSNPVTVSAAPGVYTLTLTDANNYTVVKNIQVNGVSAITATMTADASVIETGADINFTATTPNTTTTVWNFGDGATATGATTSHSYTAEGNYVVTLTVNNAEGCTSTTSQIVTVTAKTATGINEVAGEKVSIWSNTNRVYVDFSKLKNVQATVGIYNLLGQQISTERVTTTSLYSHVINDMDVGYVVVSVKTGNGVITKKLLITKE